MKPNRFGAFADEEAVAFEVKEVKVAREAAEPKKKVVVKDGKAPIIIDVRDEDEYLAGHIPGAIMVPAKQMEHHLDMMEQYRKEDIVLYCQSGRRASAAATVLENAGFKNVKLLQGDYPGWKSAQ